MYIGFGILKLRCTQCGFCGLGGLKNCKNNLFLKSSGRFGKRIWFASEKVFFFLLPEGCRSWAPALILAGDLKKIVGGVLAFDQNAPYKASCHILDP